ncbi:dolichol kinase [Episyrphus balteatus]|uniref:dolichol kinase n=1 Tax=Episyrphus balteatus TaxID=286459 RepID=UPI002484E7AB|nr:dolichol kinase [Episyrphus balteatus]
MENSDKNKVDKFIDKNGKNMGIISRPNASPGYWLSCLLPLAYVVTNNRHKACSNDDDLFLVLTIVSVGMLMQSLTFFACLAVAPGRYLKLFFALSPGVIIHLQLQYWTQQTYGVCLAIGFGATLGYQYVYVRVLKGFPKSCTLGEACILVQGVILFIINGFFKIPVFYNSPPSEEFGQISAIMMGALACLLVMSWLIATFKIFRSVVLFYISMIVLVVAVCTMPVTKDLPIITVIQFIYSDLRRVYIVVFYLTMAIATILAVKWQIGSSEQASTRVRKIFHILIVLVYIPGLIYQCTFLYLATGVALAAFSVLDMIRMLKIPPISSILDDAFATLHDEKDAGNIALTPFCLLIGCSLPMWINPCPCSEVDSASGVNMLPMLAGILSVGIGDTSASILGSKFGRHKWSGTNRSIEGSLAFILSQSIAIVPLYLFNLTPADGLSVILSLLAIVITSLVEAFTDQIDNLVLPLIFYIVVNAR